MIFGDIRHYSEEKITFPPVIRQALEAIHSHKLAEREVGRYEIEGGLMFALVQEMETKSTQEQRFEAHETHVDIQYLVRGEEKIQCLRHSAELTITEDLMKDKDVVFFADAEPATDLILRAGEFAVLYPWDVHKPGCTVNRPQPIKKIVVKIHKQLWGESSPFN